VDGCQSHRVRTKKIAQMNPRCFFRNDTYNDKIKNIKKLSVCVCVCVCVCARERERERK